MSGTHSLSSLFRLLWFAFVSSVHSNQTNKPFNCKGGSIYFAAHPVDLLLYQNPALFHDLYVFKCTTMVLFTSGDRGILGDYSRLLERGVEEAVLFMNHQPLNSTWDTIDVQLNGKLVLLRSPRELTHVQTVYLRLPNAIPDGQPYPASDGGSLKKLYNNDIDTLATTDGSATYNLNSLKDLIATILKRREASNIHVLDYKTAIPEDHETHCDHADHSVSARLVAEVIEKENITTHLRGYAASFVRSLDVTLEKSSRDLEVKSQAFFEYAKYDNHTCKDYKSCVRDAEEGIRMQIPDNDDVQYVIKWLEREYVLQE